LVSRKLLLALAVTGTLSLGVAACGDDDDDSSDSGSGDTPSGLSGSIRIDGSSTVGPLTEAVAEQFNGENPDVDITVGQSGTGGGFEKFCAGETAMNDASRPIEAEEKKLCQEGGVSYEEVQVANDALTVVVNPNNPVTCVTIDQLAAIWGPENPAASWGDVEDLDAEFTAELERFGPGTDSGTFDYFTDAVNGEEGVQTKDYNNVGEDDNQTVTGVQGSEGGIGYFGYSYYAENEEGLKALEVENEEGDCVAPSEETVQVGSYNPLGRELFVYPSTDEATQDPVSGFLTYYVDTVNDVAPSLGFIPMTEEQTSASQDTVSQLTGG
jgi:phosphate transport system substrate-binding protein